MATPFLNATQIGKYTDQVLQGRVFTACNTGAVALSLNSTTATGFILSVPVTATVNLVILQASIALATAPAGAAPLIWTGNLLTTAEAATTHTTPLTVKNCLIGSTVTGSGKADSAATVPTPAAIRAIGGGPVAGSSITPPYINEMIDGAIILTPGCCISIQCLTTAISAVISVVWREDPV